MNQLTAKIRKIEAEKQELAKQIKILETALIDASDTNNLLSKKNSQYKENMFKLKSYCNEMLCPKIKNIEKTYFISNN